MTVGVKVDRDTLEYRVTVTDAPVQARVELYEAGEESAEVLPTGATIRHWVRQPTSVFADYETDGTIDVVFPVPLHGLFFAVRVWKLQAPLPPELVGEA